MVGLFMVGKSWVTTAFILMMKSNDTLSDDCGCYDYMECLITQTRADNTSPDEMIKNKDYAMQANSCLKPRDSMRCFKMIEMIEKY